MADTANVDKKEEEAPSTETPEERLAWLRAHGVTVETVEDRYRPVSPQSFSLVVVAGIPRES